jgi:hypothetical protein
VRPTSLRLRPGWAAARAVALALPLFFGCRQPSGKAAAAPSAPAPEWVTLYHPRLAWNGYTLTLHQGRIPVLLDMNGRPVHQWPAARVKSRVRLLADGSILGIGLGRQVVEYDWEGRQTWSFPTPGAIPHHDVLRLGNGNTLVLLLRDGDGADLLREVDRAGRVVWSWVATEHLKDLRPSDVDHPGDVTHINSLEELPENPWHQAGDRRFRPGNLLLSARNLSTIFIVDRQTGAVVWQLADDLDRQHEARMIGPGLPGAGRILLFNNRLGSFWGDHQSELLELDPRDGSVSWRYRSPGFFSPTGGVQQLLPNGNLLVTSTRGGRVFEVTRAGQLAWTWVPPYEPARAVRVAPDACPQLAALPRPTLAAVVPPPGYAHVDPDAYRFARQGSRMQAVVAGEARTVLKEESDCRDLTLPRAARLEAGYGIDPDRLRTAGRAARPPEFTLRLDPEGPPPEIELLRETVGLAGPPWRRRTIRLDAYALKTVRLCVEIDGGRTGAGHPRDRRDRFAFWEQPQIASALDRPREGEGEDDATRAPKDLTPEELEVRQKHLRSLGYIN